MVMHSKNPTLEGELWHIFTFYALRADPSTPEMMTPPTFLRFSKDCQFISKALTATAVDLEIGRMARSKSKTEGAFSSITILFPDFLDLLNTLAARLYHKDDPDIAIKRLILENVLLFANRRVPLESKDISPDPVDHEAVNVVMETNLKGLMNIFDFYLDKANTRRNQAVAVEKVKQRDATVSMNREALAAFELKQHPESTNSLAHLKQTAKLQKELIGYREYIQFTADFSLKSTYLLTAVQVGEVYLSVTLLDEKYKACAGMSFAHFCEAVILMAYLAHREFDGSVVTPANKVKALLLYMWKAVNDSSKSNRRIAENRSNVLTSYAGSLNIYGSGVFSDLFLNNWTKDGFRDYTLPVETGDSRNNTMVLQSVVGEHLDGQSSSGSSSGTQTPTSTFSALSISATVRSGGSKKSLATTATTGGTGKGAAETRDWLNSSMGNIVMVDNGTVSSTVSAFNQMLPLPPRPPKGTVLNLRGTDIAILLAKRPELAEFLYLEIQTMKSA